MTVQRTLQRTISFDQGLQLGQVRPADINPLVLYTLPDAVQAETDQLEMANTTASVVLVQVFHDTTGSTTTPGKCIFIEEIPAQQSIPLDLKAYLNATGETLSVQTSVADSVTFTLYGRQTQERAR